MRFQLLKLGEMVTVEQLKSSALPISGLEPAHFFKFIDPRRIELAA